ncbi:MAG: 3'-5' exonuclease [Acholeplasmatales bacterium]|nr:MAG: 3'-5' exonuclease [Acholeplasmatales bacterium]
MTFPSTWLKTYEQLLVFDLETTGFNPKTEDIIDVGAVLLKPLSGEWVRVGTENMLVRTPRRLSEKIISLTGITDSMLLQGIEPDVLAETFERLMTPKTLVIAYNLQFDLSFVHYFMKRQRPYFMFQADVLDLLTVYKDVQEYPHRLENALATYGIAIEHAHRAFDDAEATATLMVRLDEGIDLDLYVNQIGYHEKYGLSGVRYDHVSYHAQSFVPGSLYAKLRGGL